MSKAILYFYHALIFALSCTWANVTVAQSVVRNSLGLYGGRVNDIASTSDGSAIFAACEGPYGIFFTNEWGGEWSLGLGGDYEGGTGSAVVVMGDSVYAALGNRLYETLPTEPTGWMEIELEGVSSVSSLATADDRLFVGTNAEVIVHDGESIVDRSFTPLVGQLSIIAPSSTQGSIFIEIKGNNLTARYYRTTYNSSTGDIGDSWTEVTPAGVDTGKFSGLAVDPTGRVYISTFNAGNGDDGTYRSDDDGDSFVVIPETAGASNGGGLAFGGTTYLVGNYISNNSGTTFVALPSTSTETTPLHLSPNLHFLHPTDNNKAYRTADVGVAVTSDLQSSGGTWVSANAGLEGVTVEGMAQFADNKDIVFLATSQLCALTSNFTDPNPSWSHPILPGGSDGGSCRGAALDPTDQEHIYTASSRVYSGDINLSNNPPTIDNWQTIDDPSLDPGRQFFQVTAIKTYSFLPTTLLASFLQDEGGIDGEFSMYDTANSFAKTTPADLQGLPIRSFEVIDTSTIFVGAGVPASNATASTNGIYRSTDSGASWSEIIDTDLSSTVNTNEFAYDSAQDILYAAAEDGLFRLSDATTVTNWERCNSFTSSGPGSGNEEVFTVAVDLSTGALYAASGRDVYRSNDNCDSWSRIYEGLDSEITSTLFFDALVQGSNTGFYALEENDDVLTSPSYVLWNGFLQMVNILELVNKGTSDLSVTISPFDINGVEQSETTLDISAQNQRDVIVNDLTGFSADSYGLLRLTFSSANLDGRMFFYRTLDSYQSYEFAYALPLSNARDGTSYVAFNTFNPSLNAADSGDQVLNWLSIVNLSSETESFEINRYGLDGTLLATQNIGVQAFGRTDIDGGHGEGNNVVGYNEIVPADPSAQYKAELVRYGQRTDSTFAFAFPLVSTSAEDEHWVEISAGGGAQNWLEVQNIGADAQNVNLYFYDNNGNLVSLSNAALGARSGVHLDASAVLGAGQSGAVHIQGTDDNDVLVAQSMFYFRDSSGSIEAMYGSQPPSSLGGTRWGSWNLFLNAYNWLRLFNTGDSTADVVVTVYNGNNTPTERAFALAPKSGTDLGLHETSSFATSVDTYGSVKVEGSNLLTGLLRIRPTQSGGIDFAAPTAVRP